MKKVKRYVFEFALLMVMWMVFNAIMSVSYGDDWGEGWMQLTFGIFLCIIADVIGGKFFNCS
jgi:hypothetical protein